MFRSNNVLQNEKREKTSNKPTTLLTKNIKWIYDNLIDQDQLKEEKEDDPRGKCYKEEYNNMPN